MVRIRGAAERRYTRHPEPELTTHRVLAEAARQALADAELHPRDVDGLGVSSFTLRPDRGIDFAVELGLELRWLMDGDTGGVSAADMVQHAVAAIEAGDAANVLLIAGDAFHEGDFRALVDEYNVATRDHLAPIPFGGPNALFALLTRRHMERHGLERSDYGRLVVAQRRWAGLNPGATYREPLTIEEYLDAPIVADPLGRYDCVPVVSGADAVVLSAAATSKGPRVRSVAVRHNAGRHEGDGLTTGLAELANDLWERAGAGPGEMDVVSVYDDYPAVALIQLADLGFGDPDAVLEAVESTRLPVNTSGGQLSAGQAGAAGGMHGLVEVVEQLRYRAGDRQVGYVRLGVVTGYGMVAYRFGASAGAIVLEAP